MPRLPNSLLRIAGIVCCALLGWRGPVQAEMSAGFRFNWSAPDECPTQQQVQAEIARLVHDDLRGHELAAKATVSHGSLWSADLTTEHAGLTGHRTIEAPSCKAAADAIALIVALLIDPDALPVDAQTPGPQVPVVPEPPKSGKRKTQFLLGVHAQGRVGVLPGADLGVGLGVGLASVRWRTDVRWSYGLRRDQVAALPSGASGRFNVASGSVTECLNLGRTRWGFGPCAALEAGRVSVKGFGATAGFTRDTLWLALGAGAFLSLAMGQHLHALLEADLLAPMYRPDYVFQDVPGVVFRAPAVGGRALADISWHF